MIVQEAPRTCGYAAELAAVLAEKAILDLRGPVLRVTGYDVPVPVLEDRGRVHALGRARRRRGPAAAGVLTTVAERLRLWLERGESGYWLRDAATGEPVRWSDERLLSSRSPARPYRLEALQDGAFAPGRELALVPEPDNPHDPNAVAVWDAERRLQAGYVPAEIAPRSRRTPRRVALWEFRGEDGRRVGLRVLIAPADAWIGRPRA